MTNSKEYLLTNKIQTPDGTILESTFRHDYVTYTDANGLKYMVDGGLAYLRRNLHSGAPYKELSVYDSDPHETIREEFTWGTYGKDGKGPFIRVKLCEMSNDHISSIIKTQTQLQDHIKLMFMDETNYRYKNGIKIDEH